jgi:hypothetical protein
VSSGKASRGSERAVVVSTIGDPSTDVDSELARRTGIWPPENVRKQSN